MNLLTSTVSFEEFSKIDIQIGKILDVEKIDGSKKLLKLKIEIDSNLKQSISGIGDIYTPEELKSKLVAVVINLKPRKIFGLDSEVMLLAAVDGELVSVLKPDKEVKSGSKVT